MKRIISLTSIPPRFKYLWQTLQSLVDQQAADEVRLYIPKAYKRFSNWDGTSPDVPKGVSIVSVDQDLGPATKVLCAAKEFANQDVQILFCDDDGTHKKNWANRLFAEQAKRPHEAVATWGRHVKGYLPHQPEYLGQPRVQSIPLERDIRYRLGRVAQKIFDYQLVKRPSYKAGYCDVFFGVGGVVVRPSFFDEVAYNIPEEAWLVDDIWLSAMLAKNNIPVYCPSRMPMPIETEASEEESLLSLDAANEQKTRQSLNRKAAQYCFERLGIWQENRNG